MRVFISLILFIFFVGCNGVDPRLYTNSYKSTTRPSVVLPKLKHLVKDEKHYICKAKIPNIYRPNTSAIITFDFKNFPNAIHIKCQEKGYYWCDGSFGGGYYEDGITVKNDTIYPLKHDDDTDVKIKSVNSNHILVDFKINSSSRVDLDLACVDPLKQVSKVDKITSFKPSPYSDKVLMAKLDKLLKYGPSLWKYNEIKKLVSYGVYISKKDIRKSLGLELMNGFDDYPIDYRVFQLLKVNSGIKDSEIFRGVSKEERDILVKNALAYAVFSSREYRKMQAYAFAKYFIKMGTFSDSIKKVLYEEYPNGASTEELPQDLKKMLYKAVFEQDKYHGGFVLYIKNFPKDPYVSYYLKKNILSSHANNTPYMNLFLLRLFHLSPYEFKKRPGKIFKNYRFINDMYSSHYGPKFDPILSNDFKDVEDVLRTFLSKNKPDVLTASIYDFLQTLRLGSRDLSNDRKILKQIRSFPRKRLLAILNSKNTSQIAKAEEYHSILAKMIKEGDHRGAIFYLRKGAKGDASLMIKALEKNFDDVARQIALQNISFDSKAVLDRLISMKKYDFISFLIRHKKLSNKSLSYEVYKLLKANDPRADRVAKELFAYGVSSYKTMKIAKRYNDEKVMKKIVSIANTRQNRELLSRYKKEQKLLAIKRAKEAKAARLAEQRRQERLRRAYLARKRVGDKVCKDGRVALFLNITMKGYVERVRGNSIQIRIADTEGTTPYYNGVRLYPDKVIWDNYTEWRKCR
ncbi:MAG: hypothetical protein GXO12_02265 [Epsilonproteobacteria bacterium]|nr:hypothetical protein [Campylobacterota bacterium]